MYMFCLLKSDRFFRLDRTGHYSEI